MRRLTNLALTRLLVILYFYKPLQRISDSNGCGHFNQISFKLTTIDHSVNSLFYFYKPNLYNINVCIQGNTTMRNLGLDPFNTYILGIDVYNYVCYNLYHI